MAQYTVEELLVKNEILKDELRRPEEYDGEFHYQKYWGSKTSSSLKQTQRRDIVKNKLCKQHKIKLIRITA